MRIFKTKWLARYARRERIPDASLIETIVRADRGLIDADLGGGLIKQRVARSGQGRSGGYRMLVAYRAASKSERDNIGPDELSAWREIGARLLGADERSIASAIDEEGLQEITHGADEEA